MVLFSTFTLSHSACLLPHLSDRPTIPFVTSVTFSHVFDSSLYEFPLLPDLRQSDRPKGRPSDRRSIGNGGISHLRVPFMSFTSSQTSDEPTEFFGLVESTVGIVLDPLEV